MKSISMYFFGFALTALAAFVPAVSHAGNDADRILGVWLTQDGKARVQVVEQRGIYGGHIIWLKQPLYPANDPHGMGGKPRVDRRNPRKSLRERPIIGLPLVSGFHYAGDGEWDGGIIYDPESGKTYRCKMTLTAEGTLRVRGYVGISLFGRTTVWTRVTAPDSHAAAAIVHSKKRRSWLNSAVVAPVMGACEWCQFEPVSAGPFSVSPLAARSVPAWLC